MSELRTNRIVPRDGLPSGTSGDLKGGGILQIVTKFKKDAQVISGSGNVTQFRIFTSGGGNFTSGTVTVRGIA